MRAPVLRIGVALLVVVALVGLQLARSPQRQVIKCFQQLTEVVTHTGPASPLHLATRARTLRALLADPIDLDTPIPEFHGRLPAADAVSLAMSVQARFVLLILEFEDYRVAFTDRRSATVTVTGRLRGVADTGDQVDEIYELHCLLRREGPAWRFTACTIADVLEK